MSKEQKFLPIDEIDNAKIRFDIPFPNKLDTEQIGINLKQILKLMRTGGIANLDVVGNWSQETSRFIPNIAGFNPQGNAYAAKSAVGEAVPLQKSSFHDLSKYIYRYDPKPQVMRWIEAEVDFNLNEINTRIDQSSNWQDQPLAPEAWSHFLDQGLKEEIKDMSWSHQIKRVPNGQPVSWRLFQAASILFSTYIGYSEAYKAENPAVGAYFGIIITYLLNNFVANTFMVARHMVTNPPDKNPNDIRFSLFYGPEIDNALKVKLMSKFSTLAKAITPHEE